MVHECVKTRTHTYTCVICHERHRKCICSEWQGVWRNEEKNVEKKAHRNQLNSIAIHPCKHIKLSIIIIISNHWYSPVLLTPKSKAQRKKYEYTYAYPRYEFKKIYEYLNIHCTHTHSYEQGLLISHSNSANQRKKRVTKIDNVWVYTYAWNPLMVIIKIPFIVYRKWRMKYERTYYYLLLLLLFINCNVWHKFLKFSIIIITSNIIDIFVWATGKKAFPNDLLCIVRKVKNRKTNKTHTHTHHTLHTFACKEREKQRERGREILHFEQ